MNKVTGRLENWTAVLHNMTQRTHVIYGDMYDDERNRFDDGTRVNTSTTSQTEFKEGDIVETRNSSYLLGKPLVVQNVS